MWAANVAAASASGAVTAATGLAPAEPSFWSQALDDLSDTFQAGQLANASFGTGIIDGAADIVKFARSINPEDHGTSSIRPSTWQACPGPWPG